jgi:hypothetical protein
MKKITWLRKKAFVLLLAGSLLTLAAGVSYGAIPGANGTISACKDNKGSLKVIDAEAGQTCNGSQQLLSWNQQGTPGAPGANGVSGYETVDVASALNSTGDKTVFAHCPSGKKALGGGGGVYGPWVGGAQVIIDGVGIVQDHPFNDDGWIVRASEFVPTDDNWYLFAKVTCADVS